IANRIPHRSREVRIIHCRRAVRPHINSLMSQPRDELNQFLFQQKPGMIRPKYDSHLYQRTPCLWGRRFRLPSFCGPLCALIPSMLPPDELRQIDAWWRAANYLSVGQIYLLDNPLLTEPLTLAHIKPRLLGHWGTTPGLNFIYAHCNRVIKKFNLDMIYICGPGHGGPGMVEKTYL